MANLQKCCKCKSEQELKYFSLNKKGQLYKTCDVCREKRRTSTNDKDKITDAIKLMATATQKLESITNNAEATPSDTDNKSTAADTGLSQFKLSGKHYADVDKEMRAKYENEFRKDSHDRTMGLFTQKEQIDRYAKMFLFLGYKHTTM